MKIACFVIDIICINYMYRKMGDRDITKISTKDNIFRLYKVNLIIKLIRENAEIKKERRRRGRTHVSVIEEVH